MQKNFTERDTETYYDSQDAIYSSFWDPDGSVHWGYFDESTGNDFLKACANLSRIMAEKGQIDQESKVLDLGCGNGTTSLRLHDGLGCEVVGIDLSGVRIDNAKESLKQQPPDIQANVAFEKASATDREMITLKLSTADVIMEGIHRVDAWSRIEAGLGGIGTRYRQAEDCDSRVARMTLSAERKGLLGLLTQEWDATSLCRAAELPSIDVCRTLWAFRVIGAIEDVE